MQAVAFCLFSFLLSFSVFHHFAFPPEGRVLLHLRFSSCNAADAHNKTAAKKGPSSPQHNLCRIETKDLSSVLRGTTLLYESLHTLMGYEPLTLYPLPCNGGHPSASTLPGSPEIWGSRSEVSSNPPATASHHPAAFWIWDKLYYSSSLHFSVTNCY